VMNWTFPPERSALALRFNQFETRGAMLRAPNV
jgi:hypothetical protein